MLVSHPTRNYLTRIEKFTRVQRSSLFCKRFRLHRKKVLYCRRQKVEHTSIKKKDVYRISTQDGFFKEPKSDCMAATLKLLRS
jgi:hypothetical protein